MKEKNKPGVLTLPTYYKVTIIKTKWYKQKTWTEIHRQTRYTDGKWAYKKILINLTDKTVRCHYIPFRMASLWRTLTKGSLLVEIQVIYFREQFNNCSLLTKLNIDFPNSSHSSVSWYFHREIKDLFPCKTQTNTYRQNFSGWINKPW